MANPYKKDRSIIYHFPLVDIPDYISQTGFLFKKKRLSSYEGLYVMCVKFLPMRSYPTTRYTALLVSSVSYFLPSSSCRLVPFAIAGQVPFFCSFPHIFPPNLARQFIWNGVAVSQARRRNGSPAVHHSENARDSNFF